jgi:hypothetical protein
MFFLGQKNGKTVFLALKHGEQKHQSIKSCGERLQFSFTLFHTQVHVACLAYSSVSPCCYCVPRANELGIAIRQSRLSKRTKLEAQGVTNPAPQ